MDFVYTRNSWSVILKRIVERVATERRLKYSKSDVINSHSRRNSETRTFRNHLAKTDLGDQKCSSNHQS